MIRKLSEFKSSLIGVTVNSPRAVQWGGVHPIACPPVPNQLVKNNQFGSLGNGRSVAPGKVPTIVEILTHALEGCNDFGFSELCVTSAINSFITHKFTNERRRNSSKYSASVSTF